MPLLKMDLFSTLSRGIVDYLISLPVQTTDPIVKAPFILMGEWIILEIGMHFELSVMFSRGTVCFRGLPGLLSGWQGPTFCSRPTTSWSQVESLVH